MNFILKSLIPCSLESYMGDYRAGKKKEWEKVETVTDFLFLGSKITVDCDCSHEIKRCLLLRRKDITNLEY